MKSIFQKNDYDANTSIKKNVAIKIADFVYKKSKNYQKFVSDTNFGPNVLNFQLCNVRELETNKYALQLAVLLTKIVNSQSVFD